MITFKPVAKMWKKLLACVMWNVKGHF